MTPQCYNMFSHKRTGLPFLSSMGRARRLQCRVKLACWNMHSLVENKGGMEIARARPLQRKAVEKGGVERRTALMIWEFKRYKVFAASFSETKWFRNGIYEVEDHTILHSAHNMLGEGEPAHRGEVVGLVLSPAATQAWRQG